MPAKKRIHKLNVEPENDFYLIGIASHENDYRLSWALNQSLKFDLVKENNLTIHHPKHKMDIEYSMYSFEDDNEYLSYSLISNKSEQGFLLPNTKNIDFIMKVSGSVDVNLIGEIVDKLKKVDIVITAFVLTDLTDKLRKIFCF